MHLIFNSKIFQIAITFGITAALIASEKSREKELLVAVASNFSPTLKILVKEFKSQSKHKITLINGSTGKHYAQIINGAPFDLFFAADKNRPELLEKENIGISNSRFTYAIGKIALWTPTPTSADSIESYLKSNLVEKKVEKKVKKIALANPKLAPYGRASVEAIESLKSMGIWNHKNPVMVKGENIAQTYQFIHSENVDFGFVALSQLIRIRNQPKKGKWWPIPKSFHSPIIQQAILLRNSPAAQEFLTFIKSKRSKQMIIKNGYDVP